MTKFGIEKTYLSVTWQQTTFNKKIKVQKEKLKKTFAEVWRSIYVYNFLCHILHKRLGGEEEGGGVRYQHLQPLQCKLQSITFCRQSTEFYIQFTEPFL